MESNDPVLLPIPAQYSAQIMVLRATTSELVLVLASPSNQQRLRRR